MKPCADAATLLSGKRIAIVALSARGGTALCATGLARRLGQSATVLYVGPERLPLADRPPNVEFLPVETGQSHWGCVLRSINVARLWRVAQKIREFRPDVAHFPLSHPWNFPIAQGLSQIPVVFTLHDVQPHSGAKWQTIVRTADWFLQRRAARLIVLSRHCYQALPARETLKTSVIPHPAFEHYGARQPGPKRECGRVIFFGRLEPYKGLETLYDAAERLRGEGWPGEVVIAGSGPLPRRLRNADPRVVTIINRWLAEDEVSRLLATAGVLVLPYRDATQSGALAAAYGAGAPVIASRVGSLPEFIEDGVSGLLVEPEDSIGLANAIRAVTTDPEMRARLQRGAATAARALSWDSVIARHAELYATVAASSRS